MKFNSKILSLVMLAFITSNAFANALSPSHFYIRGDLGAAWMNNKTLTVTIDGVDAESKVTMKQALAGQIGFGYILNQYWRFEFAGNMTGKMDASGTCVPSTECIDGSKTTAYVSSEQLFLTAYLDFGRLFGQGNPWFNPYVGGGIGGAHNKIMNFENKFEGMEVFTINDNSTDNFAWRLVGGVALAFGNHFMIDFSYGYVDAGTLETGSELTLADGLGEFALESPGSLKVDFQQVMMGLRYRF